MDRTDSSSAMMLLQYGEDSDEDTSLTEQTEESVDTSAQNKDKHSGSREDEAKSPRRQISEEDSFTKAPADFISDEEGDHHRDRSWRRESDDSDLVQPAPRVPPLPDASQKMAPDPANVSSHDENSSSSVPEMPRPLATKKTSKLATRLVSYGPDDVDEDEDASEESEESAEENEEEQAGSPSPSAPAAASPGPRGLAGIDSNNIQLPPEPASRCSKELQEKIADFYMKMKQCGFDPNREIQRLTSFRNPSIYEKLIQQFKIDEKGSNFPLDVYNPHMWGKESFYDELDKAQKKDMERREKDRKEKTKIEFISGTKKSASSDSAGGPDEKKRKSKWDAQPGSMQGGQPRPASGTVGVAGVANLTTSITGTKATVISAVGTLKKK